MMRFIGEAHPAQGFARLAPTLAAHSKRLEQLPVFQVISQAFIAPA
jgi:hypothetical protein